MGKYYMDEAYLINPILKDNIFRSPNYYNYVEKELKGYTISKLVFDDISYNTVIDDFDPICALIIINKEEVVLFKNKEKVMLKNHKNILKVLFGQIDYIEQDANLEYILSDINLELDDFITAITALMESSI